MRILETDPAAPGVNADVDGLVDRLPARLPSGRRGSPIRIGVDMAIRVPLAPSNGVGTWTGEEDAAGAEDF